MSVSLQCSYQAAWKLVVLMVCACVQLLHLWVTALVSPASCCSWMQWRMLLTHWKVWWRLVQPHRADETHTPPHSNWKPLPRWDI